MWVSHSSVVNIVCFVAECKTTQRGENYMGTLDVTNTGIICQRWDTNSPHYHGMNYESYFPDDNMDDAANHCRNPDLMSGGPWCYTIDSSVRWQYCDVPWCGEL